VDTVQSAGSDRVLISWSPKRRTAGYDHHANIETQKCPLIQRYNQVFRAYRFLTKDQASAPLEAGTKE